MAEITAKVKARILEIGDIGDGKPGAEKPAVTLDLEDGEILLELASIEECRVLAPLLGRDIEVTIAIPMPEKERRRG